MLKAKKINIADTNLANFGTELEKSVKRAAALSENQWNNAGTEPGIQIWRIEKFKVVPWPKKQYGQFHIGDSYIVLHTQKKKNSDALVWDVYFWLGDETTQDEAGTAAYKTVELDDVLRGAPVQHREVQGFESAAFLALFAKFEYLEGGVETGFRHVEPEQYRSRLLHVKGKEKLAVFEVDRSVKSMNCGDVFILDCGLKLIQFNGKECSTQEKMKAGELVRAMRDERGSKAEIVTVEQESNGPDHQEFFKLVGGSPADIQPASVAGDDLEVQSEKVLFRLTDGEPNAPAVAEPESDTVQLGVFDATKDAEAMRGALKKLIGKDSALIIEMFARRTQAQLKQIASKYAQTYKRDMCKDIKGKSKTAFDFKHLIDDMLSDPLDLEVDRLLSALGMNETSEPKTTVDKAGPLARIDRGLVSEIILIRDAQALQALTTKFKASTGVELKTAIEKRVGTLFGSDLKKLLLKYLETPRSDGNADDAAAKVTAAKLIKAGEGKFFGTNSDTFIEIFATQSYDQLRKVFEEYDQQSKYGSIDDSLKHELSGQFREAMRLIVSIARGETPNHFARRLHKSMKGLGTDDSTLRYIIISYRKIINEIKAAYYVQFGRTLSHDIEGDTSGNYKKLLLKLVGEDDPAKYGHKPLKFEKVASGVITRDQLDSGDVFVLYNGFEVFAWVGKGSSKVERRSALQYAQMFLSQAKLPQHTSITRILEGGENTLFEKSFD